MRNEAIVSSSEEETETCAGRLVREMGRGVIFALHGDLGVGKTVFARGAAKALGVTEPVTSPTFTIVQEYPLSDGSYFFHLDLYRIPDVDAAFDSGLDEYLECPSAVTVIEWPERIAEILPPETVHVFFRHRNETSRLIALECSKTKRFA